MTEHRTPKGLTPLLFCTAMFCLASYFTFAAVQGDYGIFKRVQIESEIEVLAAELEALESEVAEMRNKTRRLSDDYLDLDLLDIQAREVLGMMRMDEVIIQ